MLEPLKKMTSRDTLTLPFSDFLHFCCSNLSQHRLCQTKQKKGEKEEFITYRIWFLSALFVSTSCILYLHFRTFDLIGGNCRPQFDAHIDQKPTTMTMIMLAWKTRGGRHSIRLTDYLNRSSQGFWRCLATTTSTSSKVGSKKKITTTRACVNAWRVDLFRSSRIKGNCVKNGIVIDPWIRTRLVVK